MASLEGKNLGPYRVIEQIGSGGMAKIFKAYQPSMERYVALKVLPEHFADDPRFTERFDREARVIARLEHKNILPVHDFGEQDGITYLVMRYLEGGTLKKVLSSGRLTLKDIDDIMTQVCEALDYAHRKGVVHRDVKPSNIMIDNEGSAYLTDFGIAKVLEGTVELTETGAALGTPAYMSPEQGLGHKVDSRSDIYSLGVILYEMLVGHVPFQADTPMAVALAHIHEPLPLPRKINPEIPEAIEAVVIKALAKEPDDRYQTASEMAVALKKAIRESKVAAYESTLLNLVTQPGMSLRAPTEVRSQVAEAPVEAKAPAIREALRKLPLRTIGIVLGAVVVLAVILYAGSLLVGRLKEQAEAQPTQAAEVAPTKAETVQESVKIIVPPGSSQIFADDPTLYDSFDDPAFDGALNPLLWRPEEDCMVSQFQQDGVLVTTNQGMPNPNRYVRCALWPGLQSLGWDLPSLEAQMYLSSDAQGGNFQNRLEFGTDLDRGWWNTSCVINRQQEFPSAEFSVSDPQSGEISFERLPLVYDRWYTLRLQVEPGTMTFSCLVDGRPIGSYTPEDPTEFQEASFTGLMGIERAENTVGTIFVDNFRIIPPGAGQVFVDDPTLYDSFDDPGFDGTLNPLLWDLTDEDDEEGCEVFQQDGVLVTTNQEQSSPFVCDLWFGLEAPGSDLPSLEAQMYVSSESHGIASKNSLNLTTELDGRGRHAECSIGYEQGGDPQVGFGVFDERSDAPYGELYYAGGQPLEFDRWYTLRLQVDPGTMTFSCLVDDQIIGSYTAEDPAELQTATFWGNMGIQRAENTVVTILIDNFRIIPPGAGQVFVDDPTLYDSFDDPAYDGSLNPLLWAPTGEEGCEVFQQDGVLVTTNQKRPNLNGCPLWFGLEAPGSDLPSLEAQMYVSSDSYGVASGDVSYNGLGFGTELDGQGWNAICNIGYEQSGTIFAWFGVYDGRSDTPYGELYYAAGQPLEFDRWYTLHLQVDPGTMTFSCLVDGQLIGSYTLEDPAELQAATFVGNMGIERAENTVVTILVDNFRIIPPGAGWVPADDPTLYDSFDDPAYDGALNLNLWAPSDDEGCIVFQQDGVLVTTNQEMPNLFGCALWLGLESPGSDLPSLEAQMNVSSDSHGGFYKNYLELATDLESQWWSASCAFAHHPDFLGAEFEVYDRRLGGAPEDALSRARQPLEHDRWYTLRLQVDPGTMTFSCLVDGQPIGSYTPEDPAELQAATFAGLMGPERAENTVATIFVDNFRIIPPGLIVPGRAPNAPPFGCFPPPEGMVGWWPGDGHDRDLAGSHYGRLENQVRFAQGMVGQAFQFPSSSSGSGAYVIAENIAERIDFQGITLEAWVQLSSGPVGRIERFVTFGEETAVLRHGGDGMLHFYMSIDGEIREVYVPGILQKGGWYHVAGTYDGNFMRLYLDGVEVGNNPVRGDITRTNTSLWIGDGGEYLFGLVDEVSIYARALSPDEIRAIFEAGKLGKCKP